MKTNLDDILIKIKNKKTNEEGYINLKDIMITMSEKIMDVYDFERKLSREIVEEVKKK